SGEMTNGLSEKIREEIRKIAVENGCELVAIESTGTGRFRSLRLVLDKPAGVTLEDCEKVSRDVSPLLDAEAKIPNAYTLEVSSPGLDRKLYSIEDARKFIGRRVRVRTSAPVGGSRNFRGKLAAADDGDGLRIVDEESGRIYNFSFREVQVARLEVDWPDSGERRKKK
ncbi:MAG: ribosome maturation factor RimP, partial [Thermoanaerobaculia bacterium]